MRNLNLDELLEVSGGTINEPWPTYDPWSSSDLSYEDLIELWLWLIGIDPNAPGPIGPCS